MSNEEPDAWFWRGAQEAAQQQEAQTRSNEYEVQYHYRRAMEREAENQIQQTLNTNASPRSMQSRNSSCGAPIVLLLIIAFLLPRIVTFVQQKLDQLNNILNPWLAPELLAWTGSTFTLFLLLVGVDFVVRWVLARFRLHLFPTRSSRKRLLFGLFATALLLNSLAALYHLFGDSI